jgi:hypothetical protein
MAGESVTITGLVEFGQTLRDAPRLIVEEFFPHALEAGAEVIEAALRARTPELESQRKIHLRDALVTDIEIDPPSLSGTADTGFGAEGERALWVEFGHREVTHGPNRRQVGRSAAHPFMRPAAVAAAEGAIEAFADSLAKNINAAYTRGNS